MTLRLLSLATFSVSALLLAACATTGPQVDPAVATSLSSRGVDQSTYLKVTHGQVLDYTDILNLVTKGVPTNTIVDYLASTRKVYSFTYAQLQDLRSAGASSQLLNYLSETQGFYGNNTPKQKARTAKEQKDQYYNTPQYQDKQPFAGNPPIIDDFYDSSYEESMYSPFSFN